MDKKIDWGGLEKRLSLSMIKKSEETIGKKELMDSTIKIVLSLLVLMGAGFVYIILNSKYYLAVFEGYSYLSSFQKIVPVITFVSLIIIYVMCDKLGKLKKEYEKSIERILKSFEKDFCKCDSKCSCMDDYVKFMYDKKIKIFNC